MELNIYQNLNDQLKGGRGKQEELKPESGARSAEPVRGKRSPLVIYILLGLSILLSVVILGTALILLNAGKTQQSPHISEKKREVVGRRRNEGADTVPQMFREMKASLADFKLELSQIKNNITGISEETRSSLAELWREISQLKEIKHCSVNFLEHNFVQPKKLEYDYKDIVQLSCKMGYELYDKQCNEMLSSAMVHCQKDGTWNSSLYSCRPVDCGHPKMLRNGNGSFTSTVYKFQIMYSCDEPYYKLEGNALFECSANASWVAVTGGETSLPKCKQVCGISTIPSITGRILGGKRANLGYFPWQVRLATSDGKRGSGALISDRWVLTAAQLIENSLQVAMQSGLVNLRDSSPENRFSMERAIIHPDYRKQVAGREPNFDHDIALVKLQTKVKLGPNMSPVCLPSVREAHPPEPGKLGYIAGWGKTEIRNMAIILEYAQVPVVGMDMCEQLNYNGAKPRFTSNMICAGEPGIDSCHGDSGGPYVFRDPLDPSLFLVRGIVSFGPPQCGSYGVYTHVGKYLDWIEKTMKEHESIRSDDVDT